MWEGIVNKLVDCGGAGVEPRCEGDGCRPSGVIPSSE